MGAYPGYASCCIDPLKFSYPGVVAIVCREYVYYGMYTPVWYDNISDQWELIYVTIVSAMRADVSVTAVLVSRAEVGRDTSPTASRK